MNCHLQRTSNMLHVIDSSGLCRARPARTAPRSVARSPEVDALLSTDAAVAIGVSGKDSVACALAVAADLDRIGHRGPRVLVHADLGRVEWKDSAACYERLAHTLGWELLTVERQAGDMLARWQKRWENNVSAIATFRV